MSSFQEKINSSGTTPSSGSESAKVEAPWYIGVWNGIILPPTILISVLGSILIIWVMPRKSVSATASVKIYYLVMAVGDMVISISLNGIVGFLSDGLYYVSNGRLSYRLDQMSNGWCKFWRMMWFGGANISDWAIVVFAVERTLAIWYPLRANSWFTAKRAILFNFLVVLPITTYNCSLTAIVFEVDVSAASPSGFVCKAKPEYGMFYNLFWWPNPTFLLMGHTVIIIIANAFLVYKLYISREERSSLSSAKLTTTGAPSAKEINAAITLLILTGAHIVGHFPSGVLFQLYYALDALSPANKANYLTLMRVIRTWADFTQLTICIPHSTNFIVFFCRMPSFRAQFVPTKWASHKHSLSTPKL